MQDKKCIDDLAIALAQAVDAHSEHVGKVEQAMREVFALADVRVNGRKLGKRKKQEEIDKIAKKYFGTSIEYAATYRSDALKASCTRARNKLLRACQEFRGEIPAPPGRPRSRNLTVSATATIH